MLFHSYKNATGIPAGTEHTRLNEDIHLYHLQAAECRQTTELLYTAELFDKLSDKYTLSVIVVNRLIFKKKTFFLKTPYTQYCKQYHDRKYLIRDFLNCMQIRYNIVERNIQMIGSNDSWCVWFDVSSDPRSEL